MLVRKRPQSVSRLKGLGSVQHGTRTVSVSLSLDPFSDEQWGYVIETMSQRAIFAAKLLAGNAAKH